MEYNDEYTVRDESYAYDNRKKQLRMLRRGNAMPVNNRQRNRLGAPINDSEFGWIGRALTKMGNTRRHVLSLNEDCGVIISQTYPLQLLTETPGALYNACVLATQGAGEKTIDREIWSAGNLDLTLGTRRVFGVHIRITDSDLAFKRGTYTVQLLDNATVLSEAVFTPIRGVVDAIMLAIGNTGGMASVPGAAQPIVKIIAAGSDLVTTSTACFAETLNMRDLGVVANAPNGVAV